MVSVRGIANHVEQRGQGLRVMDADELAAFLGNGGNDPSRIMRYAWTARVRALPANPAAT
jgi:hypothetical protein